MNRTNFFPLLSSEFSIFQEISDQTIILLLHIQIHYFVCLREWFSFIKWKIRLSWNRCWKRINSIQIFFVLFECGCVCNKGSFWICFHLSWPHNFFVHKKWERENTTIFVTIKISYNPNLDYFTRLILKFFPGCVHCAYWRKSRKVKRRGRSSDINSRNRLHFLNAQEKKSAAL